MSEGEIEHAETPGRSDASVLSFDTWAQVPQYSEAAAGLNFPELSWELAEGLLQTILETSTPDSPFMPTRLAMMQQLQADAARALVSSNQTATAVRAMQLLMTFETLAAGALSNASAWSLPLPAPLDQLAAAGGAIPAVPSLAGTIDGSPSVAPAVQIEQSVIGTNSHLIADLSVTPLNVPVVPAFDLSRAWSQVSNCSLGVLPLPSDYEAPADLLSRAKRLCSSSRMPTSTIADAVDLSEKANREALCTEHTPPQSSERRHEKTADQGMQTPPVRASAGLVQSKDGDRCKLAVDQGGPSLKRCLRPRRPKAEDVALSSDSASNPSSTVGSPRKRGKTKRKKRRKPKRLVFSKSSSHSSSAYRGVSRHRLTQRWEASIWLSGKQLYLGGFHAEEDAAKAYDIAAMASKGWHVPSNFGPEGCAEELKHLANASQEEIVAFVRRSSSAFARGRSSFRGVSGQSGRWEARIGSFAGKKNVSFGIHATEVEAAKQYDRALIIEKGRSAKTNFPLTEYEEEVKEYESLLQERLGHLSGRALKRAAAEFQLPLSLNLPGGGIATPLVPDRKQGGRPRISSAALIYAEELRVALAP